MLNEYLWKEHKVVCLLLAPSCFYPSLPEASIHFLLCKLCGWQRQRRALVETGGRMQTSPGEQASSEWRVGGGVGGWRCPQSLGSGGHWVTGTRRCPRGGKELFKGAEAIRPHLSSPAFKKNVLLLLLFFSHAAWLVRILGTRSCVSPVVDCQISPPVASLFKNIYLIFKFFPLWLLNY